MRDRFLALVALAVLVLAVTVLVIVWQQNQPTTGQTEPAPMSDYATMFAMLKTRVDSDALYVFRIRHEALGEIVEISQSGTRLVETGRDYFCLSNTDTERFCYPYAGLLVVAIPE